MLVEGHGSCKRNNSGTFLIILIKNYLKKNLVKLLFALYELHAQVSTTCRFLSITEIFRFPTEIFFSGQFPGVTQQSDMYLGLGPICRYADDLEPMLKCMAFKDGPIDFNQKLNYDVSFLFYKLYFLSKFYNMYYMSFTYFGISNVF